MKILSLIFIFFSIAFSSVWAQSEFSIRFTGVDDNESPTTPTLLNATPIAFDQIDISWTTSTDIVGVAGYVIYRDAVAVATTSLTSFSDIALVASTTYMYEVRAFDQVFNYSSSSNSLFATTPEEPVVLPPATSTPSITGSQSTATRVITKSIQITPARNTTDVLIETRFPARFEIRWGRTSDYELGYTINRTFSSSYKTTITDLEPDTEYLYEIIGYTPFGAETILDQGSFITESDTVSWLPANVSKFAGQVEGANVRLSWQLPSGDFDRIRIVRNHLDFPKHQQDGAIIYEGRGESFLDQDILRSYSPIHYTAFVISASGAVSSGAVVRILSDSNVSTEDIFIPPANFIPRTNDVSLGDTEVFVSPVLPAETRLPALADILIFQSVARYSFASTPLQLDSQTDFIVSIPREVVTEKIKSIVLTLADPTDNTKTYAYLLRQSHDNSAYEVVVPAMQVAGGSRFKLDIYELSTGVVATYIKHVSFTENVKEGQGRPIFPDLFFEYLIRSLIVICILILLCVVFFYLNRRRAVAEDNK